MFTGIIRHQGIIKNISTDDSGALVLTITTEISSQLHEGDSVAVNGVCLTVLTQTDSAWTARLMQETLNKTNLKNLQINQKINLELSMQAGEGLHGHVVQGHVDGTATMKTIAPVGDDRVYTLSVSKSILKNIVAKGSVALDGVSLTVVDVFATSFTVSLMPYTLTHTTLGEKKVGDALNIETDKQKHVAWVSGIVVEGDKRGTAMGFPTANIQLEPSTAVLSEGVFAARAMIAGDPTIYAGALHIGPRPTFHEATDSVELHIINFSHRNLCGETISFAVIKKLRDIQKFDSVELLVQAIADDVQVATSILLKPE